MDVGRLTCALHRSKYAYFGKTRYDTDFPVYVNSLISEVGENNTHYSRFYITGNTIVSITKIKLLMLFRDSRCLL